MPRVAAGWVSLAAFIAMVWLANWAIDEWGVVDVGLGLMAPAGVYFAGAALTLRDLVHRSLGRYWVIGGIVVGAALSAGISDTGRIAVASGVAFFVSEMFDLAVYEPTQRARVRASGSRLQRRWSSCRQRSVSQHRVWVARVPQGTDRR